MCRFWDERILTVLEKRDVEFSFQARILLCRWFAAAKDGLVDSVPRAGMGKRFRLPEHCVSASLTELLTCGYVVKDFAGAEGRGRRREFYQLKNDGDEGQRFPLKCSETFNIIKKVLELDGVGTNQWKAPASADAASGDGQNKKEGDDIYPNLQSGRRRKATLSFAARILLATLWAHSRLPGIVRSLSQKDLMELTSLTPTQIKYQLGRLKALGYMHSSIPGHKGCDLISSSKTTYFLNLAHSSFGEQFPVTVHCIKFVDPKPWMMAARDLTHRAASCKNPRYLRRVKEDGIGSDLAHFMDFHKIVDAFSGVVRDKSRTLEKVFQTKLDGYVSFALTTSWDAFDSDLYKTRKDLNSEKSAEIPPPTIPKLHMLIRQTFPSPLYRIKSQAILDEVSESSASQDSSFFEPKILQKFIYLLTVNIAWRVRKELDRCSITHREGQVYRVMPRKSSNHLTVVVTGERITRTRFLYYDANWKETIKRHVYEGQSEIPAGLLRAAGLEIESES